MKHLIVFSLSAMCYSCAQAERVVEIQNNNSSVFTEVKNAIFSDSCILIPAGEKIVTKESFKNFEWTN